SNLNHSHRRLIPCLPAGPVSEASDGKELLEGQDVNMAHPKVVRSVGGHRHNAWRRYRRPRPRLSHKGPMPF
uniref:Apelin n=1 Tax=Pseudonaja textilis TaxID=8673 RepID=A0A670YC81_PSETE